MTDRLPEWAPKYVLARAAVEYACHREGVSLSDVRGSLRDAAEVRVRRLIACLLVEFIGTSTVEAGRLLGKSHSTIVHAVRRVKEHGGPEKVFGDAWHDCCTEIEKVHDYWRDRR